MVTVQVWAPAPLSVRTRRRDERRRLARHDVLSARLAELTRIEELLVAAQAIVGEDWVQHAWFRYQGNDGRTRTATAHDLGRMAGRPVVGACLVGAEVQAGGGVGSATSQLVARSLDLTWHTLRDASGAVEWCPSPPVRQARVRDLTRWNDTPGRQAGQVTALLAATARTASAEACRVREERFAL